MCCNQNYMKKYGAEMHSIIIKGAEINSNIKSKLSVVTGINGGNNNYNIIDRKVIDCRISKLLDDTIIEVRDASLSYDGTNFEETMELLNLIENKLVGKARDILKEKINK